MTTVRQLIVDSLQLATAIGQYEDPTANEYQQALRLLNDLLGKWSLKGLTGYRKTTDTKVLTPGADQYTIGLGGQIDTEQPTRIYSAVLRDSVGYDRSLQVISDVEYNKKFPNKTLTGMPEFVAFTKGDSLGKVWVYPTGLAGSYSLILYSTKPVSSALVLSDSLQLPAGWQHLLKYNLAVLLAPFYGKEAPDTVKTEFVDAKTVVMTDNFAGMNFSTPPLETVVENSRMNINTRDYS